MADLLYRQDKVLGFPELALALRKGGVPPPAQVLVSLVEAPPGVRMMPGYVADQLVRDCSVMRVRALQFTGGGEPCLHPDFGRLCQQTVEGGMALGVVTNGTVVEPKWYPALQKATWVRVSINAGAESTYRKIHQCGQGMWDQAWDTVRDLAALGGPEVGVSMVVCSENRRELGQLTQRAYDAGAHHVRITPNQNDRELLPLSAPEWSPAFEVALAKKRPFDLFVRGAPDTSPPKAPDCYYRFLAPYVGADCNVYQCCNTAYTERGRVGNVREESFRKVWNTHSLTFDARECPQCAFKEKNELLAKLVHEPTGHDLFP